MITDGRFSGATHGFMVGHVAPEAAKGGPIALIEDGDIITLDVDPRILDVAAPLDERAVSLRAQAADRDLTACSPSTHCWWDRRPKGRLLIVGRDG